MKRNILQETFEKHVRLMHERLKTNICEKVIWHDKKTYTDIDEYIENGMDGDLMLSYHRRNRYTDFPDSLTKIGGTLYIGYHENVLKSLGKLQEIEGGFYLDNQRIEKLPDTLTKIGEEVKLGANKKITELPKSLTEVGGNLIVAGCQNLKSLGGIKKVGGELDLWNCRSLESIEGIEEIGGKLLDIRNTRIEKIPESLKWTDNDFKILTNHIGLYLPWSFPAGKHIEYKQSVGNIFPQPDTDMKYDDWFRYGKKTNGGDVT